LQLHSNKASASDFNFITATAADQTVFNIRGDGLVSMMQLSIASGGLQVLKDGLTILNDGMKVFSASTTNAVATIKSTALLGRGAPVLVVSSVTSSTSQNYLFRAQNKGLTRFTIRADGRTDVYGGGLSVTGGITMQTGGLSVFGGQTVTMGLVVVSGGATILSGGIYIGANGASVMSGGVVVNNGTALIPNMN
jgi:hypothetical protein